jgi:hypothetical protein
LYSGFQIRARHSTLLPAIGTFAQEKLAEQRVTLFSWLAPMLLLLVTGLDLLLVWIYSRFAHPWADILAEERIQDNLTEGI